MSQQTNKITIIAARSGIIVEAGKNRRFSVRWRLIFIIGVCMAAVVAVAVVVAHFANQDHVHKIAVVQQQKLQQDVEDVNAVSNLGKMKADSNALIEGAKDGSYTLSNKQLAGAYATRGDAEFNQGDTRAAIADYKQAVQLDASQQDLVGYNEFLARYQLGERKSLVPLLQTLEKPYKNNHDTGMQEHYDQYQGYISDLQAGKELDL